MPALIGAGALFGCAVVLLAVTGGLALAGQLTAAVLGSLVAVGAGASIVVAAAAAAYGYRFGAALRAIRADVLDRLQDEQALPLRGLTDRLPVQAGAEVRELARTLDALFRRLRVSDEVAEQYRRSAETASAGMSELLSGLVAAEEGARGQLAAELHDTVAQSLMMANAALSSPTVTWAEVARVTDLVADAEEQVRAVMARTRPPALRDGDLARAVSALCADLEARYGLMVRLTWPAEPHPLPLATAVTVYRFFQEALLNVVKHADMDEAFATLVVDANGVTAQVRDEGPGFDPDRVEPERGRHVGLGLLRERARLAGGSVEVRSWPSSGTTLSLWLPRPAALPRSLASPPEQSAPLPSITASAS